MRWNTTRNALGALGSMTLLLGMALIASGAKNGCIPVEPVEPEPECKVSSDCDGLPAPYKCIGYWTCDDALCNYHCGFPEPECKVAEDCAGMDAPVNCPVKWDCVEGTCQYECTSEPTGCYGDQDCPAGTHCNAGEVCLPPPGCKPGMACPAVCYGQCVADSGGCDSDADCKAGQVCQWAPCPMIWCEPGTECDPYPCPTEGTCVDVEPPPYECSSDADCGPDAFCAFEVCADCYCADGTYCDPAGCGCWGHCEAYEPPPPPPIPCNYDGDCPAGTTCQCGMDPSCPMCAVCYFQCLPAPELKCASDADCGAGQFCEIEMCSGCACAAGMPCDCPPEPSCVGTCKDLPEPVPCDADGGCPAGTVCECGPIPGCPECDACLMQCVPAPELVCEVDSDCPAGQACVLGPCPLAPCSPEWCPPCYGTCQDVQPPPPPSKCVVSGCSGEICAEQPMASDCSWDPAYECLKYSQCGNYAPDGSCGWAKTPEYQKCMTQFWNP